ncbi:MAG: hypothetical protein AAFW73_24130, partial [Bacteroidota bacterium]
VVTALGAGSGCSATVKQRGVAFVLKGHQIGIFLTFFLPKLDDGPLFYGRRAPGARPESRDNDWLLRGAVDKPVYLTCRVHKAQKVAQLGSFVEIGRKNGFVFFKREPQR